MKPLTQKIAELVPEIRERPSVLSFNGRKEIGVPDNNGPRITLADVLRAIEIAIPDKWWCVDTNGEFIILEHIDFNQVGNFWNLAENLSGQSKETIEFLTSLICG